MLIWAGCNSRISLRMLHMIRQQAIILNGESIACGLQKRANVTLVGVLNVRGTAWYGRDAPTGVQGGALQEPFTDLYEFTVLQPSVALQFLENLSFSEEDLDYLLPWARSRISSSVIWRSFGSPVTSTASGRQFATRDAQRSSSLLTKTTSEHFAVALNIPNKPSAVTCPRRLCLTLMRKLHCRREQAN